MTGIICLKLKCFWPMIAATVISLILVLVIAYLESRKEQNQRAGGRDDT